MTELQRGNAPGLEQLFAERKETMIRSFFQGYAGRGWVDDPNAPTCGRILTNDFCYVAGDPRSPDAPSMVSDWADDARRPFLLMKPSSPGWELVIESTLGGCCKKITRYQVHCPGQFNLEKLETLAETLPQGYEIVPIDGTLYHKLTADPMLRDLCSGFATETGWRQGGIGVCALHAGEPVGGAASYIVFQDGIEIEVDVTESHRRKGLAAACCARLILICLQKGLSPCWDAHDLRSVALAQKLGYQKGEPYTAYEIATEYSQQ